MKFLLLYIMMVLLSACNTVAKVERSTLSDFIVEEELISKNKKITVSNEEAKKSYDSYLLSEGINNENRKNALQRLAEIQLDIEISKPVDSSQGYNNKSVPVFKKRLKDYPKDKNNDRIYYQLANAYAVIGNEDSKISTLETLTDTYPDSKYYVESMFRLGESYIGKSNFIDAELALTAVIAEDTTNKFRKNSLFKRAWSRYKQLQYQDAIDDYNQLLSLYPTGTSKNRADKEFLNNIYKVYGVCISYLGIDETLSGLNESLKSEDTRFHVYNNLSQLLVTQDRYLDAANVLEQYLKNENEKYVNQVILSLSDIWLKYENREYAMNKLFSLELGHGIATKKHIYNKSTIKKLSNNLVLVSEFYHSLFQKGDREHRKAYLSKSLQSYTHLINNYNPKNNDKYGYLYAELLNDSKSYIKSIAAYEDVIIKSSVNSKYKQKSTYSLLVLANNQFKNKRINSAEYSRINDKYLQFLAKNRVYGLLLVYSEFLYNNAQYLKSAAIIEEVKFSKNAKSSKLLYILASSYFEIKEYELAIKNYHIIKGMKKPNKNVDKRLALAIFKQADVLKNKLLFDLAISKYNDIYRLKLDKETILLSKLEMSGLFIRLGKWGNAEEQLTLIRKLYKNTRFSNDVTHMLSVTYFNNNKQKLAAVEFEKIHGFGASEELRRSALWQSAELYEKGGDLLSSARVYKRYANRYKKPLSLNIEAQYKLSEVYSALGFNSKRDYWLKQIIKTTDKGADRASDRMKFLASNASIVLARTEYQRFSSVKLTIPLKVSLRKKKNVLKKALSSLQKVNKYKMYEHVSESIYWIAETYYEFSENLMKSERPKNLSGMELEQYNILLEDQAIPFEDQAIRYFIQNIKQSNQGLYSEWMSKSFEKLSMIYPSKYMRVERLESQVNRFF